MKTIAMFCFFVGLVLGGIAFAFATVYLLTR